MKKRFLIVIITLVTCISVAIYFTIFLNHNQREKQKLQTYFDYTETELTLLSKLHSSHNIDVEDIYVWQDEIFDNVGSNKLSDIDASALYAAVTVAQRDAAFLSYNNSGKFAGSLDPVTQLVVCLFVECKFNRDIENDSYSHQLADIVVSKIKEHIADDKLHRRNYKILGGEEYWTNTTPPEGIDTGSRKTWFIETGSQFRVEPLPFEYESELDLLQLNEVKTQLANITESQQEAVIFWAGGPGTKTPPGTWLTISSDFMKQKNVSLKETLKIRSVLAMTMADAVTAAFDSKLTYQVKRPYMRDKSIRTIMPTPNHPSYPAGHATISGSAQVILTHYFPENTQRWEELALEASNSRTWGGIHFPIDNEAGLQLGIKVAEYSLAQDRK